MKTMTKLLVVFLIIFLFSINLQAETKEVKKSVADENVETVNSAEKSPLRILLAMEKTKFKQKLIASMKEILEEQSVEVTVLKNHKKEISEISAEKFDAVFITNSGVRSKVRPWIVEWLEVNNAYSDKILLHTTQTKDWEVKVSVDAVTSASLKNNIDETAQEYVDLLLEKTKTE